MSEVPNVVAPPPADAAGVPVPADAALLRAVADEKRHYGGQECFVFTDSTRARLRALAARMPTTLWPWDDAEQREAARREKQVERRMGICIHFRDAIDYRATMNHDALGTDEQVRARMTCRAGVFWPDVELLHEWVDNPMTGVRVSRSLPCNARLNPCGATCAKRATPTRDAAVAIVRSEYERANESHVLTPNVQSTGREAGGG